MSSSRLQKIFRTLGDPTRVRLLLLLEREELAVQELMDVLDMAQSRVSRHLGILREAGLVRDRREGTFALYRFETPAPACWRDAWALAREALAGEAALARDRAALTRVLAARATRAHNFFDAIGDEWEHLRQVWGDELLRARAVARLAPPGLRVADIGAGSGVFTLELAEAGCAVIACDPSDAMLARAQKKLAAAGFARVEFRRGDTGALPLADGEVHAAFAHMALQYFEKPDSALPEIARVVRPGGRVVVADFIAHDREWMRQQLGARQLGFAPAQVEAWFKEAGLTGTRVALQQPAPRGKGLPATFIVTGQKPEAHAGAAA